MAAFNKLIAVRAVTAFIVLERDPASWDAVLEKAIEFTSTLARQINSAGYEVQSLRLIANPFGEYLDTSSVDAAVAELLQLQSKLKLLESAAGVRVRFSIGAAVDRHELSLVPAMIKAAGDLANCCINIPISDDHLLDYGLVTAASEVCAALGRETPGGEGNFNFTINFNGPHLCPYFPAGFNKRELGESFVIGLEYPNLLVDVLERNVKTGTGASVVSTPAYRAAEWRDVASQIKCAVEEHIAILVPLAQAAAAAASGLAFAGIDSSPAPSFHTHSMCRVIELLGLPYFGSSGTVEVCAFLTRIFKSLQGAPLVGFSGLMFAALEDAGLAAAALEKRYDIRALLTYSAVCGIGLDTIPIPGDASVEKIAQMACDCGTLAFRLNKPLTVRLFPVPGKKAGDMTEFDSKDLCNCRVFELP